ncbi:hypothetical protein [Streptomyces sp. NPDC126503]|uniref:hypothetical protein n=1 Tax=Streptomyces sp. NPDC126503 TaxID=3155315 RepID=UPI00331A21BD
MSESPDCTVQVADPAVINCRIRALLLGGELSPAGLEEYGRLLLEWEAAVRVEQELAA